MCGILSISSTFFLQEKKVEDEIEEKSMSNSSPKLGHSNKIYRTTII